MSESSRVFVIVDPTIPTGEIHIGGAVVLPGHITDAELGFAVSARPIRIHSDGEAIHLEKHLATDGCEVKRMCGRGE